MAYARTSFQLLEPAVKAVLWHGSVDLRVEELADPVAQPGETVVDVELCGVCGSDLHPLRGHAGPRRPPLVLGHELVGTVRGRAGHFVAYPLATCGECESCRAGLEHLCVNRGLLGLDRHGAFAERVAVRDDALIPLPEGLAPEHAVLTEPLATAVSALRQERVQAGSELLVVGGGPIGLLTLWAAHRTGAHVTAVEPVASRRALASELGADAVHADVADVAPASVGVAIDAVGARETVAGAIRALRPGGRVAVVGLAHATAELPLADMVRRGLALRGHYAYTRADFQEAVSLLAEGGLPLHWLETTALAESPAAVLRLLDHPEQVIKLVLSMGPEGDGLRVRARRSQLPRGRLSDD
jgi:threonine dehydrogenase-like Zn-dependent dehydrogenase